MINVTIYETGTIFTKVEVQGHASQYAGDISSKICFAVSTLCETINRLNPKNVLANEKGYFVYDTDIDTDNPSVFDITRFTYIESLITGLGVLSSNYKESFTYKVLKRGKKNENYR